MIRYDVSLATLEQEVDKASATWRTRAAKRKLQLKALKAYAAGGPDWSDVKVVYMRAQGESKCVYCERKLEAVDIGLIEQDVEHFRPKSSVGAWPAPPHLAKHKIRITPPPRSKSGYYLLPHELYNYAASCKPCNSVCKSDYFPISGKYDLKGADPTQLLAERPLLIYPIGHWDDDPEALIGFLGTSPYAKHKSGHAMHRALVTITFFKLDDVDARSNLFLERAQGIVALYQRLKDAEDRRLTAQERKEAAEDVAVATSPKMPHANCLRSFAALFKADRAQADITYQDARRFRNSKG